MKKYIQPTIEVQEVHIEQIIAASPGLNNEETDSGQLSNGASIYFTLNGSDPTTSSTLYNSAGIVVSETTTLKAIAVKTGMDDSEVAEATYVIYKNSAAGTVDDPYAVADARAHIDAGTGVEEVYAWGIVSEIVTPFSSEFGNITYNISADGTTTSAQLQAYRGKDKDGASFTSENDVQVGDYVVVFGNLQKHGDTYEFAQDNQRVDYSRNTVATPTITPDGGTFYGPVEVTIACETPDVTIEYVLDNGEGDLWGRIYFGA